MAGRRTAVLGAGRADDGQGGALARAWPSRSRPAGGHDPADTVGLLIDGGDPGRWSALAMGFVTYLLLAAVAAAGSLIDVFGGFSLAQGFDPLSMNSEHRLRQVPPDARDRAAVRQRRAPAGHRRAAADLPLPPARRRPPTGAAAPDVLVTAFGLFFVTAVQIALPMIAVLFLADLGLALLTKVAPQLNAINVMFPAKIGLTLLLRRALLPGAPAGRRGWSTWPPQAMAAHGRARGDGDERGEDREADPQGRKENRKEGQVPRTQELGAWSAMLAGRRWCCPSLLGRELTSLRELMATSLDRRPTTRAPSMAPASLLGQGFWHVMVALVVLGAGVMVVGVAGALAQGGFFLATKSVKPKLVQAEPAQGRQADLRAAGALGGRQDAAQEQPGRRCWCGGAIEGADAAASAAWCRSTSVLAAVSRQRPA